MKGGYTMTTRLEDGIKAAMIDTGRAAANIRGLGYEAKVVKNEKAAASAHTSDGQFHRRKEV